MRRHYSIFWSYAHGDNANDRGRLVELANDLESELRLLSGHDVEVFLDRKSLHWGDQWRARIDSALEASTFLIPVLTPLYFKRPECRQEMLRFHAQAASRGLASQMLPLLYSPIADFSTENPDELISVAARTQYEQWSELRLADTTSAAYRAAVHRLAKRILTLAESEPLTSSVLDESPQSDTAGGSVGFVELLSDIQRRFGPWLDRVLDDELNRAMFEATDRVNSARIRNAPRDKRLAAEHRSALAEWELIKDALRLAREYAALTLELHPGMTALLRALRENPDMFHKASEIEAGVQVAFSQLTTQVPANKVPAIDYYRYRQRLGGVFLDAYEGLMANEVYREEGNLIVAEWQRGFAELRPGLADAT
jgi:hypothetical protein